MTSRHTRATILAAARKLLQAARRLVMSAVSGRT